MKAGPLGSGFVVKDMAIFFENKKISWFFYPAFISSLFYVGTNVFYLLVSLFLLFTLFFIIVNKCEVIRVDAFNIVLLFYVLSLFLSAFFSLDRSLSINSLIRLLFFPLLALIFIKVLSDEVWYRLISYSCCIVFLSACIGLYEYFLTFGRVDAQLLDANAFAMLVSIGSLLCFYLSASNNLKLSPIIKNVIQFSLLFSLFASFSRGGFAVWILGFSGIVVSFYIYKEKIFDTLKNYLTIALLAYFIVRILPFTFGYEVVTRSFGEISTLNYRVYIWEATWDLVISAPLYGFGLGTFLLLYPSVRTEYHTTGNVAHNDFLQIAVEGGVLSLIPFCLIIAVLLWYNLRILFSKNKSKNDMEVTVLSIILATIFIGGFFNFVIYVLPISILMGLLLARVCYLLSKERKIRFLVFEVSCSMRKIFGLLFLVVTTIFFVSVLTTYVMSNNKYSDYLYQSKKIVSLVRVVNPYSEWLLNYDIQQVNRILGSDVPIQEKKIALDLIIVSLKEHYKNKEYSSVLAYNIVSYELFYEEIGFKEKDNRDYLKFLTQAIQKRPDELILYSLFSKICDSNIAEECMSVLKRGLKWIPIADRSEAVNYFIVLVEISDLTKDIHRENYLNLLNLIVNNDDGFYNELQKIN